MLLPELNPARPIKNGIYVDHYQFGTDWGHPPKPEFLLGTDIYAYLGNNIAAGALLNNHTATFHSFLFDSREDLRDLISALLDDGGRILTAGLPLQPDITFMTDEGQVSIYSRRAPLL